MELKLIELRDRGTFISAVAILVNGGSVAENYLCRRAGYALNNPLVMLGRLEGDGKLSFEFYDRTWKVACDELNKNWEQYDSGDVLDVEFILGERGFRKVTERSEGF